MKNYIVTINEYYVRDTQVYMGKNKNVEDIYDDDRDWKDFFPIPFLGVYKAKNKKEVIQHVSKITGYPLFILKAEEIDFITKTISANNNHNVYQMTIDDYLK